MTSRARSRRKRQGPAGSRLITSPARLRSLPCSPCVGRARVFQRACRRRGSARFCDIDEARTSSASKPSVRSQPSSYARIRGGPPAEKAYPHIGRRCHRRGRRRAARCSEEEPIAPLQAADSDAGLPAESRPFATLRRLGPCPLPLACRRPVPPVCWPPHRCSPPAASGAAGTQADGSTTRPRPSDPFWTAAPSRAGRALDRGTMHRMPARLGRGMLATDSG